MDIGLPFPVAVDVPGVQMVVAPAPGMLLMDVGSGLEPMDLDDPRNPLRGIHPDAMFDFRGWVGASSHR